MRDECPSKVSVSWYFQGINAPRFPFRKEDRVTTTPDDVAIHLLEHHTNLTLPPLFFWPFLFKSHQQQPKSEKKLNPLPSFDRESPMLSSGQARSRDTCSSPARVALKVCFIYSTIWSKPVTPHIHWSPANLTYLVHLQLHIELSKGLLWSILGPGFRYPSPTKCRWRWESWLGLFLGA